MIEGFSGVIVVKSRENPLAANGGRHRQKTASQPLGQADDIRLGRGFLTGEEHPGAPKSGQHLIVDGQHVTLAQKLLHSREKVRAAHPHAPSTLH